MAYPRKHKRILDAYARLAGKDWRFIKGQKYTLLSSRENLTLEGIRTSA